MIKLIQDNDILFAKIIRANSQKNNTEFYTDTKDEIQFGIVNYAKNHKTGAHYHNHIKSNANQTDEILIMQNGSARIDFYNNEGVYIKSCEIFKGDVAILYKGGHNILFYEDSQLYKIQTGPYNEKDNKTRIVGAHNIELNIEN